MTENGGAFCSRLESSWEAALSKKCPVESCNEFLSTGAVGLGSCCPRGLGFPLLSLPQLPVLRVSYSLTLIPASFGKEF